MAEDIDVVIVGAGLSGIGAAYHVRARNPGKRIAILEARGAIGGTWDLFRYPGIRSDSDMYTLGYSFRPWRSDKAIADGPSILAYIEETAREHGIEPMIRFHHKVVSAAWSSETARWSLEVKRTDTGETARLTCGFLFMCSGYYSYDAGYTPPLPGLASFAGTVVHPQAWPEDLDYTGKRVVVIGSGATAVTLVPSMAPRAAHVTMLQRSPTYIVSRPSVDRIAQALRRRLPDGVAHDVTRWKNVALGSAFYNFCKKFPRQARRMIDKGVRAHLGEGSPVDVAKHFNPTYDPWDQRLCLVPDGDLFRAVREGKVEIVTDTIDRITETGIRLTSGRELPADIIVTATGLQLVFLGGMSVTVDGKPVVPSEHKVYKGAMLSGVPNLAMAMGYTNASWTLKSELIAQYVARLIAHMDRRGLRACVPEPGPDVGDEPVIDLQSGYVTRALPMFPRQGSKVPWKLYQNYVRDLVMMRHRKLEDRGLVFRS
ncbi:MAG: NAD(P)/FAD-dependent oxidoreductase [Deltaproteobacteria bacterium]|nr:NAD(P)/FAD-dependent oxidoreductase [Kofleriaceae bacterium]